MDRSELQMFERSLRQAAGDGSGEGFDRAVVSIGWPDALAADAPAAISVLFPVQGESRARSSALDMVMAHALVGEVGSASVALPWLGEWSPPGTRSGNRVSLRAIGTTATTAADQVLFAIAPETGDGVSLERVDRSALTVSPVAGIDPDWGLVAITGEDLASTGTGVREESWDRAVALGQIALGYELAGCARAMLGLARQHATERVQFGRPIGAFQAVRHRLAETLVAVEGTEAFLAAAAETGGKALAPAAKALSGRSALTAARHSQQVLAGIGFTAEHPFHRYLRRVLLLDQLLGSSRRLTEHLGSRLLATRRITPVRL